MDKNAVEFLNVTKDFGTLRANDDISFAVKKGSIHALIGENGAGKSTLTSILFGLYQPTKGTIKINEQEIIVKDPNQANTLGIGMVHQHFKLVNVYTNLENIVLGAEFEKNMMIDLKTARLKVKAIQDLYNLHFDLNELSGKASVATQQKVEIMKMLYRDAQILIFDEPTAVLTDQEIQGLLKTMKIFKENGKTIIFISHKLHEVKDVADEATVLRKGKVIGTYDVANTSIEFLAEAMVGQKVVLPTNLVSDVSKNDVVLSFENVSTSTKLAKPLHDVSFNLHKGEVLAFAGVEGNGQETLEYVLWGLLKPVKGHIWLHNNEDGSKTDITGWSVADKNKKAKINVVPGDRHKHGLILDFNIQDNSIIRLLNYKQYAPFGIINNKEKRRLFLDIKNNFDVRGTKDGSSFARSLSGGNQQKAIVGREMSTEHDILVIVQPTRGLDVGAIQLIHSKIIEEKKAGKAIILISYELDEVLALADTIAVLNGGKVLSIKQASNYNRPEIGLLMAASVDKQSEESHKKKKLLVRIKEWFANRKKRRKEETSDVSDSN
ncbi:simple sugar transport system ATP-binding protein [Metamycoplasma subdolum]|uniref:Simple sugar transport system ATP-binding protein n=1 Tax=Metamycoplasma subdolum TaxID=92407 RepID=A0A3L9ZYF5_9BACT|nr:ABC transporter ATP-binding protein [Metamycoplasma subdolum]RMA77407.1 simple sugar transport system ATP-binding protein [Metamycoplasma subdolum]WPB50488.1 ABC transporter ATP-binding protein [Metamycoplasma subdolum]